MSITKSRDAAIGTVKPLDNYSRGVVYIQSGLESGRVQTPTRSRSAVRIDLRRPFRSASKNITLPGRTMSVDNLAGAQRSTLSTAEPDNPLVTRGSLRGEQQPKGTERSTTNLKHATIHRTGVAPEGHGPSHLACFWFAAPPSGALQALHGSILHRKGTRHRRSVSESSRARHGVVR